MLKFPRMHIADSVVNRILNAADEIRSAGQAPQPGQAPEIPMQPNAPATVPGQGAELDAKLAAPAPAMPPAEPPQGTGADEAAQSILAGGSALSGLLGPENRSA